MPNREQFESAACLEWPTEEPATLLARSIRTDGYRSRAVDDAWRWWQAGAAAEREICAKICEDLAAPEGMHGTAVSIWDVATLDCAEAIIRDRSAP